MATFKRFEDIEAWQEARKVAQEIYRLTADGMFARDFGLRDQIRRAAVSVMANIAEGFGRGGNKEFALFLGVARGSVAELKSHLYVAFDARYLDQSQLQRLLDAASHAEVLISGLLRYLAASEKRGSRFQEKP